MAALLLTNQILSLPAEAADRLLSAANGDAALFYLGLLRHGTPEQARKALDWSDRRAADAFETLVKLALAEGTVSTEHKSGEDEPPVYRRDDLLTCLREDDTFRSLWLAMENLLGKTLSDSDLQSLYTIYDYLGMPPEVIYLLARWCADETARQQGPGRLPRMPLVKKTAFRWKRLGIDTMAAAEEYLARQEKFTARERDILPLIGITGRAPVERERQYIEGWVDMGFADDAIRLAYERTVMQKGALSWAYMNSILKSWHAAGLHTAEAVEKGDRRPPVRAGGRPSDRQGSCQPSAERIRKSAGWLDEFLAGQEKKEG